jgi:predicted site-specific integrase-resolvase
MGDQEKPVWVERWAFCDVLGVPRIAVRRWISQGKLLAKREDGKWLIDMRVAEGLVERREQDKRTKRAA